MIFGSDSDALKYNYLKFTLCCCCFLSFFRTVIIHAEAADG